MERFKINNLWVHFPFVPYAPQEVFMKKMLESMDKAQNALLESPTGTGKTLCLVCASLAWLDRQKKINETPELYEDDPETASDKQTTSEEKLDETHLSGDLSSAEKKEERRSHKIYFCTRTHSQLIQAVNEFKNTSYGHLRSATLGSRKQLCLNPCALKAGSNLDDKCASLRNVKRESKCSSPGPDIEDLPEKCSSCFDDHRCQYYVNYEQMKQSGRDHDFTMAPAMDQRTLIEKSRKHKVCPFYMSRHLQKQADIIFLPYAYIFNPHILRGLQLNVEDSIIIIDEGHNLEKVCEENASFELKISDIANCRAELHSISDLDELDDSYPKDVLRKNIQELEDVFLKLEALFANRILPGTQIPHYDGEYCIRLFEEAGITPAQYQRQLYNLKQLIQFLGAKERATTGMKKMNSVISTVYCLEEKENGTLTTTLRDSFVLYKEIIPPEKLKEKPDLEPKIFFWCFNAGIIMKSLMEKGVHSFIVTSGTLAPLRPLRESLSIPFQVELLNEHVVDSSQVLSLCVTEAPTCTGDKKELLDVSYNNREENGKQLYDALGNVIREIVRYTPNGVLIFFTSSTVKNQCLTRWNDIFNRSGISLYHEINNLKEIFEEPKEASDMNDLQLRYTSKIELTSGACLIGVTSGKVSEGIDFKDKLGRAVIMVGLPYPPYFDPWVVHKRAHLCRTRGSAVNNEWYLSQAIRPVNQALGRIIRHQKDYGVVILPDDRYSTPRVRQGLPHWLNQGLRNVNFEDLRPILRQFFSTIPLRIKNIGIRTEEQQAIIRRRHQEELKKEDHTADIYFDLIAKRDEELERNSKVNAEIQILLKAIQDKKLVFGRLSTEVKAKRDALALEKMKEEKVNLESPEVKGTSEKTSDDCVTVEVKEESDLSQVLVGDCVKVEVKEESDLSQVLVSKV
ncbi:regulator of telomere elongation helicase 1 homolog [Thrips palmi]|uniref:Regulator of telomere elongation helicase 1 homolog n=1 Tax=Thrips palmi TaxID=161013 RepID=A0A6P8YCM0_THRPL|nr:regulator of telomere elongation helicase 1 homolog [Thrips palmi]